MEVIITKIEENLPMITALCGDENLLSTIVLFLDWCLPEHQRDTMKAALKLTLLNRLLSGEELST